MDDEFRWELLKRHPALDLEEEAPLYEWLGEKHQKTLQKQGARETAEIADEDVKKYHDRKNVFLQELSEHGLDMDNATDRHLALELWNDHGYSILIDEYDWSEAEQVRREVSRYLYGKESASTVADPEVLVSRLRERDLEASVKHTQKQRGFVSAFSEFVSKAIQLDYRILKFRRDVLGDSERTISHEKATSLVRSPAAQLLAPDFFTETGIPVVGHTAKRIPVENAPHHLYVEPPPRFVDPGEIRVRSMSFRWMGTNGVLEKHPVADSSVLGKLHDLCGRLAEHHPITEEQAAYLILCGGTVQTTSLSGRVSNTLNAKAGAYAYDHSTITLTIASYVTPEQVRQAYARLRAQAWAKNSYRSRSDRNIAIFRFVMDMAKLRPPKDLIPGTRGTFKFPPWRAMMKEWNKSLPKDHRWRFDQSGYTAEKRFRNAFADGYEAVTGKKYYVPKPLTTRAELKEEVKALNKRLNSLWEDPSNDRTSEQTER